jgi:hypothetical protein
LFDHLNEKNKSKLRDLYKNQSFSRNEQPIGCVGGALFVALAVNRTDVGDEPVIVRKTLILSMKSCRSCANYCAVLPNYCAVLLNYCAVLPNYCAVLRELLRSIAELLRSIAELLRSIAEITAQYCRITAQYC